jgi:glycosyltransferase involved in cell wall biosynthesis
VRSVLFVSKPVVPPWNDSSKNLVRDVAGNLTRHAAVVMTRRGAPSELPRVRSEPIYAQSAGGFTPPLADNARVLARLLLGARCDVWHFFFAPNPRSSRAARVAARIRRVPTVQTVCSAPADFSRVQSSLFADRVIVLSRHTERRLVEAGIAPARVVHVPPAVSALPVPSDDERGAARDALGLPRERPLVVYPGDLEFSGAAERMLHAHAQLVRDCGSWLVLACRAKTRAARELTQRLQDLARDLGVADSVSFLGETRAIHALLGAADVVALPAESLYAKMDLPLVLIEAMLLARPIVVADGTPAAELAEGERGVVVGADVASTSAALSALLADPARRAALGRAARLRALSEHDPRAVAARHDALYEELLA